MEDLDILISIGEIVFAFLCLGLIVFVLKLGCAVILFVALFAFLGSLIDNALGTDHLFATTVPVVAVALLLLGPIIEAMAKQGKKKESEKSKEKL